MLISMLSNAPKAEKKNVKPKLIYISIITDNCVICVSYDNMFYSWRAELKG